MSSDIPGTGSPPMQPPAAMPPHRTMPTEGPNWQEQDGQLREMWMHNQSPADIAKALDRSVPAIMTRAARLGLPRRFAPGRKPGRRPAETSGVARETTRSAASAAREAEALENAAHISMRVCLMCLTKFQSMGKHNRICPTCKNSAEFESGSRLPDFDLPAGDV